MAKIDVQEFAPNSNKSKTEKRKTLSAVVSDPNKVGEHKQTLASKFSKAFFSEDIKTIGQWITFDVVMPAVKEAIVNAVTGAVEIALFGNTRTRRTNNNQYGNTSYVSYNNYYNRPKCAQVSEEETNYKEFIFESRGDAEDVLSTMCDLIETYGQVSVADLYDLVGKSKYSDFTNERYGWRNLSSASVKRVSGGYILSLPRSIQLD